MKQPPIISIAVYLKPKELSSYIYHTCLGKSLCPFNISTEQLLGEHNFNTEDSKTVRVELEKHFDSTKKKKFETKDSKPFASQLFLDISPFLLFTLIYVFCFHYYY